MATLKIYSYFEITTPTGEVKKGGDLNNANELTVDGVVFDPTVTLTAGEQEQLWAAGWGALDDFDFLWLSADTDSVLACLVTATDNITVQLNSKQPLVIMNDDIKVIAGNTTPTDPLTVDETIDEIWVDNTGSESSDVRLVLID